MTLDTPEEQMPLVHAAINAWQNASPARPAIQVKCEELGIRFTDTLANAVLQSAYTVHDLLVEQRQCT